MDRRADAAGRTPFAVRAHSNFYWGTVFFDAVLRFVRRDHWWNVELLRGDRNANRESARLISVEHGFDAALDAAVVVVRKVQAGELP